MNGLARLDMDLISKVFNFHLSYHNPQASFLAGVSAINIHNIMAES